MVVAIETDEGVQAVEETPSVEEPLVEEEIKSAVTQGTFWYAT